MKILLLLAALLAGALIAVLVAGCQTVTRVEYYEPTEDNAEYSTPRTEKSQGHGPVKSIEGKSGVPDFSDNKTFSFNIFNLGV